MHRPVPPRWLALSLLGATSLLGAVPDARALELAAVEVRGVANPTMAAAVKAALSLSRLSERQRKNLSESRLGFLVRQAPDEAYAALQPYGYYNDQAEARVERQGEQVTVIVEVRLGEPVRVRESDIRVEGAGAEDTTVQRGVALFRPAPGDSFHHGVYESAKAEVARRLAERGYFDADLTEHRVEITRAEQAADIRLRWDSGTRYAFGPARFSGSQFNDGLLDPLVRWQPGQPYRQDQLLELQQSLAALDYFAAIDIQPKPDEAVDGQVPIDVVLAPAKRSIYRVGLGYGTDAGAGVRLGWERRWINKRGHKALIDLEAAQRRSALVAQYRIPAFKWVDGWWGLSTVGKQEEFADYKTRSLEVIGSRTGRLDRWNLTAALNLRREATEFVDTGLDKVYSTLFYPSLLAQGSRSDDLLHPRHGWALTGELRGGSEAVISDVTFLQLRIEGKWVHALGEANRLLLRGEFGTTQVDDVNDLPLSLRFFAGGDKSIRGYGYKEVGPIGGDVLTGEEIVVGGKHLAVLSAEFERMFTEQWGAAAFVDAGNAFNDWQRVDPVVGVGVGVRWHSPVGPVKVDLAHGLDNDEDSFRIHINIGPDL